MSITIKKFVCILYVIYICVIHTYMYIYIYIYIYIHKYLFFFFTVLGIELRALPMTGKHTLWLSYIPSPKVCQVMSMKYMPL
jgi:hypothetical protein